MRIRNLKPEFWTSEDIASLTWESRLIFIGMLSYVDDNGVGRDVEKLITSSLFPLEDDQHATRMQIACSLQELHAAGLIHRYSSDGRDFLQVSGWTKHQYIPRPNKERYPPVTCANAAIREPNMQDATNDMQSTANALRVSGVQGVRVSEVKHSSSPAAPSKEFDQFWAVYPKKVSKQAALKAWNRVTKKTPAAEIIEGAEMYAAETRDQEARFIKGPDGWLNAGRWEDDPLPARGISDAHLTTSEKRIATNIRALQSYEPTIHEDPFAQKAIRA